MVNGQNLRAFFLIKFNLFSYDSKLVFKTSFTIHYSPFTIDHSPLTIHHSPLPIHLRMASPFSVPSVWMVDCLILIDLMPICRLLPVIWAATFPSRCLLQILLSSIANYLLPLFYRPLFQSFHTIQCPCLAKLLLANEN